jgi:hypothetical protein
MAFFNHQKAAAYARHWAYSPDPRHPRFNPQYPRFDEDCTNFASQAMLAGGWTMIGGSWFDRVNDDVWWYGQDVFHLARASRTWSNAPNFARWLVASGRGRRAKDPMELQPGDVIQIRASTGVLEHSMVVTGKTRTDLTLSYHSIDRLDRSFHAIVESYGSGVEFVPWKISSSFDESWPNSLTYHPPLWSP